MPSMRPILLAASALALSAAGPNGKPQTLETHHPLHPAPASQAQDPVQKGRAKPYGGTPVDVLTYHYDLGRDGWNPTETDLTPAAVSSNAFGLLTTLKVDGNVFAQPLVLSGYTLPDGTTHDVLIVATGHDTVYAYDAATFAVLWKQSLGTPQSSADVGCGDIKPEYGITATPVIVRTAQNAATIYVVAATEPNSMEFHTFLHAIDAGTGKDTVAPVEIAPSAKLSGGGTVQYDPQNQYTRASLAYNNGNIYVPVGSHCDNSPGSISGWLLRYDTSLNLATAFNTVEKSAGYELASIWMTGFAPAIDTNGNVYAVTGNGAFDNKHNWGESALKFDPLLAGVTNSFTPKRWNQFNQNDTDFGSGGIMLLPGTTYAIAAGKAGTGTLLDTNDLGGNGGHGHGALQLFPIGGGVWGGPAAYTGPAGTTLLIQGDSSPLKEFVLKTKNNKPAMVPVASGTTNAGYGGSLPIISSNGANTGVVWVIRRSNPISLEAYDASKLGAPIFSANIGTWSNQGQQNAFLTASEANGRVYATGYKDVYVFGLSQ